MEFEKIVHERYATKLFDGRKIPEDKISKLFEIIRYAASSFNIQPWKVVVITDKKLREKLLPATWNQQQIPTCSHLLVFCADTDIAGNIDRLERLMIDNGADKESIKGYVDIMKGFEKNLSDEQKLSWSQRQTFLALGNALNGAKSLGFDSCPMEGFIPAEYSKILNLPKNIVPTALCTIGYAKDKANNKLRFAKDDVFIEDHWRLKMRRKIQHHFPMDDGDLTKVNSYLLSEGFTKKQIKSRVLALTKKQHKKVHELEAKRFEMVEVKK